MALMREGRELGWETLVAQGHVGTPLGPLCACAAQPPASCMLGSSALLTGRGGSCASGAAGRKVTPLGVGTGCLGSSVAPKRVLIIGSGTLHVGDRAGPTGTVALAPLMPTDNHTVSPCHLRVPRHGQISPRIPPRWQAQVQTMPPRQALILRRDLGRD